MRSNYKVKLNKSGVRELLKSSEAKSLCVGLAQEVQTRAGDNYVAEERNYPERTGAVVRPANADGHYDNLANNTLLRSLR